MGNSLWRERYNFIIFSFTAFLFWVVILIYHEKIIDVGYIIGGVLVTFLFFFFLRYLEKRWSSLSDRNFSRRILVAAFLLRLAAAAGLYFFYQYRTGAPFEFYAVDSIFYHARGQFIADSFSRMNFNIAELTKDLDFSDKGYNIYLGFIYYLFGPVIIIPRLFNVLFSTLTVFFIYKTARMLTREKTARLAAIMAMLLPNFLLYLGTHLKESLMLFVMVFALYQSVRVVKLGKRRIADLVLLMGAIFLLFMFRTVLAVIVFASFLAYTSLYRPFSRNIFNVLSAVFIVLIFVFLVLSSDVGHEIAAYYEKRTNALSENMQFRAAREGGNRFALMASAPLFLSFIIMAPFPSFVYVLEQDNLWMFLGANFIRNLYAFFAMAGMVYAVRHQFREWSLLLIFVLGYLGVLANSGFAISERFHLPVLPALIIFVAAGADYFKSLRRGNSYIYYKIYLLLIAVLILSWNYIKIAGRS